MMQIKKEILSKLIEITRPNGEKKIKELFEVAKIDIDDLGSLKNLYVKNAEKLINRKFEINEHNREIIDKMYHYMHGVEMNENKAGYDLNKGVMLCGTYGVGKSTLFYVTRQYINTLLPFNQNAFIITSVEELINEDNLINSKYVYNVEGANRNPKHVLVNEFGHHYKIKKYGSDTKDIIETFLMKRYDIFQHYGKVTHFTTNLSKKEIMNNYPAVIVDRFIEMCNVEELGGISFRE